MVEQGKEETTDKNGDKDRYPGVKEDKTWFYLSSNGSGPKIRKTSGAGIILGLMLAEPKEWACLDAIQAFTNWENPRDEMQDLLREFNNHVSTYQIERDDEMIGGPYYRAVQIRKKR